MQGPPAGKTDTRSIWPVRHGQFLDRTLVVLAVLSFTAWGSNHLCRKQKGTRQPVAPELQRICRWQLPEKSR